MSIKPWICNGSRTIVKDRWIDLHADDCALPDGMRGRERDSARISPLAERWSHSGILLTCRGVFGWSRCVFL